MLLCWHEKPIGRPAFKNLFNFFDTKIASKSTSPYFEVENEAVSKSGLICLIFHYHFMHWVHKFSNSDPVIQFYRKKVIRLQEWLFFFTTKFANVKILFYAI